jgi:hypothetical protein
MMKAVHFFSKRGIALTSTVFAIVGASLPSVALANVITFDFTGRLTFASDVLISSNNPTGISNNPDGASPNDPNGWQTPIAGSLIYDTEGGLRSSMINLTMNNWYGYQVTIHDMKTLSVTGSVIDAQFLVDAGGYSNWSTHIQWDAAGLINAINYGLQTGDKISGNSLYRDYNHDQIYDSSELLTSSLGSAASYSDTLIAGKGIPLQISAPLASTSAKFTLYGIGLNIYADIGGGNNMYVTSVSAVPVPSAVWLFGSGLLGLIGILRRKPA